MNILDRFRLDGRTALITGGGSGIGLAYAHALGEAGAKVAIADKDGETAGSAAEELSQKGIEALAVTADVTVWEDVERMVRTVVERWGALTIGVNNAGICLWSDAESMPREEWERTVRLNLNAVFFCAQAEAREMIRSGYGKIIHTASMSAHIVNTPQHQAAYNSSKAGVVHLTKSLAAEWAPKGIRVNSISPGYTRTKLVAELLATPEGKSMQPKWESMIPLGRLAEVRDLQGAAVYLASEASDYMTGADLVIDGGYCCW
jgi:NAD(P)-dependent dehydrogenase (short-subunit alcohol dehydrogenase family)